MYCIPNPAFILNNSRATDVIENLVSVSLLSVLCAGGKTEISPVYSILYMALGLILGASTTINSLLLLALNPSGVSSKYFCALVVKHKEERIANKYNFFMNLCSVKVFCLHKDSNYFDSEVLKI